MVIQIVKSIPRTLSQQRQIISPQISEAIYDILTSKIQNNSSLTNLRSEVKGVYDLNDSKRETNYIRNMVENMNTGKMTIRDGLPLQGFNGTTTISGTLFRGNDMDMQIRIRNYSEFRSAFDEQGRKITIISNQEETYDKSWLEIKSNIYNPYYKNILNNSRIKGKLTLKKRILVDNYLLLKLLQQWEYRKYISFMKKHNQQISDICSFEDILLEMKEKCIDNYMNKDTYDVIQIMRLLYLDEHQLKLDRLSTYTRRALTLSTDDIKVEMTEDRNVQYHSSINIMDLFASGVIKTDYHMLFGERFIVPYSFIEFKFPLILPDNISNDTEKLISSVENCLKKRKVKGNTGKMRFAKKYVYGNKKI